MSENYQVGELIRADVIVQGKVERVLLTYIPDHSYDDVPWRRLVPNSVDSGGWHTTDDLANIERMVAVPVISREQVIEALTDQPDIGASDAAADAMLRLFGQGQK